MLLLTLGLLALPYAPADTIHLEEGARTPSISADGRAVLELNGDLWLLPSIRSSGATGTAIRLTQADGWDRDPSWTPDGRAIVFSSDRGGNFDLWRIEISPSGVSETPSVVAGGPAAELQPAVGPDGTVYFVRRSGYVDDIWMRTPEGEERRLSTSEGSRRSPAPSPDGRRVAFVEAREGRQQLKVRELEGGAELILAPELRVENPSWAPAGDRIAFASRAPRPGVWIASADGSTLLQVSTRSAVPAWAADGQSLLLADLPREQVAYNGDPDRLGDRTLRPQPVSDGKLHLLPVGTRPDSGIVRVSLRAPVNRVEYNTALFDRIWEAVLAQYGSGPQADQQRAALISRREDLRARAVSARGDAELQAAVRTLLRERPTFRPERTGRAAVSSAHPLASEAGAEILRRGGNVVDAAVAVSFALGVVEPDASGIGGYGSMVLHLNGMPAPTAIEFLTRVPQEGTLENASLLQNGRMPRDGPVVVNVPGTVAGMSLAWSRYGSGKIPWADLIQPAIDLAENGFVLDEAFPTTLAVERANYARYPTSTSLFFPDGEPLRSGQTFRNPDLAATLRAIATGGADAFYRGEIARKIVEDLRGKGSPIQLHDLARYYAVEREPIVGTYRGHTIYSSPLATSGGVTLVGRLNLLERFARPRAYPDDAATLHAMIEAWKLMPRTRGRVADPGLWPVNLTPFTSKDSALVRWGCFDPERASVPGEHGEIRCDSAVPVTADWGPADVLGCEPERGASVGRGCRMTGTTAYVVADAEGNMISVTQTLGTWGGNFYVTPGLGFLYNDKLNSYSSDPDEYNARVPFARNVTSISPTLVFRGVGSRTPLLAVGAAGNAWITSAVYQVIAGVVDQGLGPQRALELPRFLIGTERRLDDSQRAVVQMEDGFSLEAMEGLRDLGHEIQLISRPGELRMGYGAAVLVQRGAVKAGADPRRSGGAAVVR